MINHNFILPVDLGKKSSRLSKGPTLVFSFKNWLKGEVSGECRIWRINVFAVDIVKIAGSYLTRPEHFPFMQCIEANFDCERVLLEDSSTAHIWNGFRDLLPLVNSKNMKSTHGGVLLLVKLLALESVLFRT